MTTSFARGGRSHGGPADGAYPRLLVCGRPQWNPGITGSSGTCLQEVSAR